MLKYCINIQYWCRMYFLLGRRRELGVAIPNEKLAKVTSGCSRMNLQRSGRGTSQDGSGSADRRMAQRLSNALYLKGAA
ncbi:hypothetical protein CC207_11030 [Pseudomonas sp. DrBHI1]|nr:hypothetical protein CC207_11030 [Pseudomonas sp. DrBHI1]